MHLWILISVSHLIVHAVQFYRKIINVVIIQSGDNTMSNWIYGQSLLSRCEFKLYMFPRRLVVSVITNEIDVVIVIGQKNNQVVIHLEKSSGLLGALRWKVIDEILIRINCFAVNSTQRTQVEKNKTGVMDNSIWIPHTPWKRMKILLL